MRLSIPTGATLPVLCTTLALGGLFAPAALGQDNVCEGVTCDNLPESICDAGGFRLSLTNFTPANDQDSGTASYTYEICSPVEGVCEGGIGLRAGESCVENSFCQRKGQDLDPTATCSRDCAVDTFRGLSHFDLFFPEVGGLDSCLGEDTVVTGSCAAIDNTPNNGNTASVGSFVLGDNSCGNVTGDPAYDDPDQLAKCDNTKLEPGDCIEMTINIPGELNGPGLGTAVVVSKESTDCNESCLAGPSCDACDDETVPPGEECLTRTRGFFSTHPHIIEELDLLPITVCGEQQTVTKAYECGTSEALCTNAKDRKGNEPSLALVAQLTAAKLNLAATTEVTGSGEVCGDWEFDETGILDWIAYCEDKFCDAGKKAISESGCIEALDAFNNSLDTGFDQTPEPFDGPGPAQIGECQKARGNGFSNYDC